MTAPARGRGCGDATFFFVDDQGSRQSIGRYPLPNLAGTANNYRRVGNEDHDQSDSVTDATQIVETLSQQRRGRLSPPPSRSGSGRPRAPRGS